MNKTNKNFNLALRICIILTWIMSNVSFFMIVSGFKDVKLEGLDKDNVAERLLDVITSFAKNTTFYYVVLVMTVVCFILAVLTRYKTTIVSFIFKILSLGLTILILVSGMEYIGALRSCKDLADVTFSGHDAASVAATLTDAGIADAQKVADTLTNPDAAAAALGAYLIPIIILFILFITSLHCLIKRNDPNNRGGNEGTGQY
ncbi:MAG: hypothetical protein IKO27_08070 [Ruminococcus sp.]|nr:hypothetical protein [Ruminococcus sp.]